MRAGRRSENYLIFKFWSTSKELLLTVTNADYWRFFTVQNKKEVRYAVEILLQKFRLNPFVTKRVRASLFYLGCLYQLSLGFKITKGTVHNLGN